MGVQLHRASHVLLFIVALPLLSVAIAWLSNSALQAIVPPRWAFWVDSLGTIGSYGVLFAAFDRWLWRLRLFRQIGVVEAPDMSGRWYGQLRSSYDGHDSEHEVALEIQQTFTRTQVCMYFQASRSASLIAGFTREPNGQLALHYEYQNVPAADAMRTMHIHYGTATLQCTPGDTRMEGYYYNWGRDDRGHVGTMRFKFDGRRRLHRLVK